MEPCGTVIENVAIFFGPVRQRGQRVGTGERHVADQPAWHGAGRAHHAGAHNTVYRVIPELARVNRGEEEIGIQSRLTKIRACVQTEINEKSASWNSLRRA